MKTEMKPNSMKTGLELPSELLEKTTLKDAKRITVYGNECGVVMMNEAMTAMQIIRAVDMLNTVTLGLIMRLENAAKLHEDRCRRNCWIWRVSPGKRRCTSALKKAKSTSRSRMRTTTIRWTRCPPSSGICLTTASWTSALCAAFWKVRN